MFIYFLPIINSSYFLSVRFPVINTLLDDESERTTSIVMIRGSRCRLIERGICLRIHKHIHTNTGRRIMNYAFICSLFACLIHLFYLYNIPITNPARSWYRCSVE